MVVKKVSFFPNTNKKSLKNGKIPICARLILGGVKKEKCIGFSIDEKDIKYWIPQANQFFEEPRFEDVNEFIIKMKNNLSQLSRENGYDISKFSADYVMNYVFKGSSGNSGGNKTIKEYSNEYLKEYVLNDSSKK